MDNDCKSTEKFDEPQVGLFYMTEYGKTILFTHYDFDNERYSYMDATNGAMDSINMDAAKDALTIGRIVLIRQKDMTDILLQVAKRVLKAPLSKLHCTIEAADILGLPTPVELKAAAKKISNEKS